MNDDAKALEAQFLDTASMYFKRREALTRLARLDPAAARPLLAKALEDPEKVIRREAVLLLEKDPEGFRTQAVLPALEDEDSDVRRNAARILKNLGGPEALEPLRKAAEKDASIFVRREAGEALETLERRLGEPKPAPETGPGEALSKTAPPPWEGEGGMKKVEKITEPARPDISEPEAPPWKKKPDEEIKPSLEHFKKAAQEKKPPSPLGSAEDRLPPWKRKKTAPAPKTPAPPAARMKPEPPRPPRPEPPRAAPLVDLPRATRKVRKAVAARAAGATLCPKCQWVVKPGQRFCTFCGHPMTPGADQSAPPARRRDAPRRPSRPPRSVSRRDAKPAFLRTGCIVAVAAGFIMMTFIGICVSGSSDSEPSVSAPAATTAKKKASPKASRPGKHGPRITLHLANGQTLSGNLLSQTDNYVRIRTANKILRVKKSYIERTEYHR